MTDDELRYPIGRLQRESRLTPERRAELISEIARLPSLLRAVAEGLAPDQWERAYRPGGWTARQVVHHLADSHTHLYIRLRFILTEDTPTIQPYDEAAWAELPDAREGPPHDSIALLHALHRRIVNLLEALPDQDFAREMFHPEQNRNQSIDELLSVYSWHGRHHLAHVQRVADS